MRFLISLILCSGLMAQAILTTTTTSAAATSTTGNIQLTSTTGATPGTYAYIIDVNGQPGELVLINSISGSTLTVSRGVGGLQRAHIAGAGVTLGPLAAFKTTFPNGACVATEIVYIPWININTGIKYECTGGAWTATNAGGGGGGGGNYQQVRIGTGANLTAAVRLRFDAGLGMLMAGTNGSGESIVTPSVDQATVPFRVTVAQLASLTPSTGQVAVVSDGTSSSDCATGGGTSVAVCRWSGVAWVAASFGGTTSFTQLFPFVMFNTASSGLAVVSHNGLTVREFASGNNILGSFGLSMPTGASRKIVFNAAIPPSGTYSTYTLRIQAGLENSSTGLGTFVLGVRAACSYGAFPHAPAWGTQVLGTFVISATGTVLSTAVTVTPGGTCATGRPLIFEIERNGFSGDTATDNVLAQSAWVVLQ